MSFGKTAVIVVVAVFAAIGFYRTIDDADKAEQKSYDALPADDRAVIEALATAKLGDAVVYKDGTVVIVTRDSFGRNNDLAGSPSLHLTPTRFVIMQIYPKISKVVSYDHPDWPQHVKEYIGVKKAK